LVTFWDYLFQEGELPLLLFSKGLRFQGFFYSSIGRFWKEVTFLLINLVPFLRFLPGSQSSWEPGGSFTSRVL